MPVTLGTIANRIKPMAYPFEGDTINLTFRIGKITEAWKAKLQGLANDATQTDEGALAFLDASLVDLVASWDVLDKPLEEGGEPMPIALETFAGFDIGFKTDLLLAMVHDSLPGEANGATVSAPSGSTSAQKAK